MNIHLSQLILIAAIFLFALYVFRLRSVLTDRIIYLTLVLGGLLLVIHPDLSTWTANQIGIGRGTDLILYIFIIYSLFYFVSISSSLKQIERKLTDIVRIIAINDEMHGASFQKLSSGKSIPVVNKEQQEISYKLAQVVINEGPPSVHDAGKCDDSPA